MLQRLGYGLGDLLVSNGILASLLRAVMEGRLMIVDMNQDDSADSGYEDDDSGYEADLDLESNCSEFSYLSDSSEPEVIPEERRWRESPKRYHQQWRPVMCYRCGRRGHMSFNCTGNVVLINN